jgi:hypothetical protein
MITQRNISVTEEKRIIVGLITSSEFTKKIMPILDIDYFTNSYLKTVASWCVAFFQEHEKAPNQHINDIYESYSATMKESESELIGSLLKLLSEQYDPESVNVDYLLNCARDYFRKRELEIVVNNVSVLKEKGEYDEAEEEIERFKKVKLVLNSGHLINIGDIDQVTEIYKKRDEEEKKFFRMPGDLGKYLGNFKRGDVIGYYAPAKRGKSNCLIDHFKHTVLQKRRTIFWSIEMTQIEILPRIMKAFKPMVDEGGMYSFPVFDCNKNQTGDCADRLSGVVIRDGDEILEDPTHIPCALCKGHEGKHKYDMTVYQDTIYREADDIFTIRNLINGKLRNKGMADTFKKYARLAVHPKYTLSYEKMVQDIEAFENSEGFIPDVFIVDYIDILDIGSKFDDYRAVDEAWKLLARLAGEYNVLVITATQANKEGHKAGVLDSTHQAGFYGKNQHVNEMVGLNQTPEEKAQGIIHYGITEARSQAYTPGRMCTVLTDIKSGQIHLDSYCPWI